MRVLARPWGREARRDAEGVPVLGPGDAPTMEVRGNAIPPDTAPGSAWTAHGASWAIVMPRYPGPRRSPRGLRFEGLPLPPSGSAAPDSPEETRREAALGHMNQVLARVGDMEVALAEPARVWEALDELWSLAERADAPNMAEIVRQAGEVRLTVDRLEPRLRRVLRRVRESTPLSRVQEIDRKGMIWLSRQPGRTLAERAGSSQRILAVARHESLDTPENRVLRGYAEMARDAARDWCRENVRAQQSPRYIQVEGFGRRTARLARDLRDAGVGLPVVGAAPNYVLTADPDYRAVHEAWERLMRRRRVLDDLWGWQARAWGEFVLLGLVLALRQIPGASLVAASPTVWTPEHDRGRRTDADNPLAVFHLAEEGLIVEVQGWPRRADTAQGPFGAPIWLRIGDLSGDPPRRRAPVWPLHGFEPRDPQEEAAEAARAIPNLLRRTPSRDFAVREALIVMPAHGRTEPAIAPGPPRVAAVPFGPSGNELAAGRRTIAEFVRALARTD